MITYAGLNLTNFDMDLGIFLASRGPYSWLGYGWLGCGCGWEYGKDDEFCIKDDELCIKSDDFYV